ncbi:MAG: nucleoside triphosphate pyrophosphohydrolase [Rikenellaceae bacterium]
MKSEKLEAFGRLLDVMDKLRVECPWDREQTFESLRNNTIEETYELIDAINEGDMSGISEELGDMLLHVVFYSKMGEEGNHFNIADVANGVSDKLIYRHPHVYSDVIANTPEEVKVNWEALKLKKKSRKGGVLSGVPRSLPALVKAYRISEKAAAVGFDWQQREDVWAKVREEMEEVEVEMAQNNQDALEAEMGDMLFAMINACRKYGVDPEAALNRCNKKFISRFNYIEEQAKNNNKVINELSLDEMESFWQSAKKEFNN